MPARDQYSYEQPSFPIGRIFGIGSFVIGVIIALSIVFGCYYTVNETQRAVVLRNGAFVTVAQPGWHFKAPWIDDVIKIDMQTHTYTWAKLNAYSADQQPADMKVSVTTRVSTDKAEEIYKRFGGDLKSAISRLIEPQLNKESKIVFGQFTAQRAITQRGPLNNEVSEALKKALAYDPIFIIESVQIENIDFSPEYIKSVEQRMQAEVEVQRIRQNLERTKVEADIAETKAKGEANAVRQRAQAESDRIRLVGEAEASAIKQRAEALAKNENLVELTKAEKWDGKMPTTMVPGGATPFISLPSR